MFDFQRREKGMTDDNNKRFEGFSKDTIRFLKELNENNSRQWYAAHKPDFEDNLLVPLKLLVGEMGSVMLSIDPLLEVSPFVDKTISRIYRDTRFSHNKSPFRTHMWVTFKRIREDWKDSPAYFFELTEKDYRYGMGFYQASRPTMDALREMIGSRPHDFKKKIAFMEKEGFELAGDFYKRPVDSSQPEPLYDWFQLKTGYLVRNMSLDPIFFSRELLAVISTAFQSLQPLYRFFWQAKEQGDKKNFRI
jgi:uncharacterized protein (TIGR02453 family)